MTPISNYTGAPRRNDAYFPSPRYRRRQKIKRLFIASALVTGIAVFFISRPTAEEAAQLRLKSHIDRRVELASALGSSFRNNEYPAQMTMDWDGSEKNLAVKYTVDELLQAQAEKLFQRYRPDYGAIVMIDAVSGKILALSSYQKDTSEEPHSNLALRAGYPAASVFKVITATAAIDNAGVSPSDKIRFNGGNYTLYKKNVLSDRINRWTRTISLKEAFARSINTAFGRLSLEKLTPEVIEDYASRFMFNQKIPSDLPVEMGVAFVPAEKGYQLTEVASGFNRMNRMSPIQGVMIAASIINDGRMVVPYIVDNITDKNGEVLYQAEIVDSGSIMSEDSAGKVRQLMEQTILSGTSKKSFRDLVRNRHYKEIEMGGKTGHLRGDDPKGSVDWFVGYASDETRKVAVAAVTVNKKYWTVKSAYLGRSMFYKYFEPSMKEKFAKAE